MHVGKTGGPFFTKDRRYCLKHCKRREKANVKLIKYDRKSDLLYSSHFKIFNYLLGFNLANKLKCMNLSITEIDEGNFVSF
jgi:hypothetical protein